jgi:TetR/AcrR family transcriptional regulator
MTPVEVRTDERIVEAALAMFGTRGYEATSLDAIAAELGIRKQTILYWFASKDVLLAAVVERTAAALVGSLDRTMAELGPDDDRVEAVVAEVFRFAVRQPAVLGLLREVHRLGPAASAGLAVEIQPMVERAVAFLQSEMDAGRVRRADPRLLALLLYATVVGVATEVEAQRAVGVEPGVITLRRLRHELLAYVRAALHP